MKAKVARSSSVEALRIASRRHQSDDWYSKQCRKPEARPAPALISVPVQGYLQTQLSDMTSFFSLVQMRASAWLKTLTNATNARLMASSLAAMSTVLLTGFSQLYRALWDPFILLYVSSGPADCGRHVGARVVGSLWEVP